MKRNQNKIDKIEETAKDEALEKKSLIKKWRIIEIEANNLVKTDRSHLSWRELLSRPHECGN